jgi:hypothetical protein
MPAKPTPPQELELKLEVAPAELKKVLAHPLLSAQSDGSRPQTLHAIYFDRPNRALQQAGISLRVRRNGDQRIQTIKAARSPDGVALARTSGSMRSMATAPTTPSRTILRLSRFLSGATRSSRSSE